MDLFLLVPSDVHSARVAAAARFDRRSLRFDSIQAFDRWDDLLEARLRTARVVVIDPFMAGEDLASVRHLVERLPSSGVIGYADFGNHRPEVLWRLEAMGLAGVIGFGLDDNPAQFWRALFRAASAGPLSRLLIDLRRHLPDPMVYGIVRHILESAIERESVQEVAQQLGIPARTCRRLLKAAGLPPPRRLIRWGRSLHAVRLLSGSIEPVGRIAYALDFSAPSNMRRLLRTMLGRAPSEMRSRQSLAWATARFRQTIGLPGN